MAGKKKDFSNVPSTQDVYNTIETATADETQKTDEVQETPERPKRGRKKLDPDGKPVHINLALTQDNYKYITCMARVSGQTFTELANIIIEKSQKDNAELYEQALLFRERLK